jgi:hypothetical protein
MKQEDKTIKQKQPPPPPPPPWSEMNHDEQKGSSLASRGIKRKPLQRHKLARRKCKKEREALLAPPPDPVLPDVPEQQMPEKAEEACEAQNVGTPYITTMIQTYNLAALKRAKVYAVAIIKFSAQLQEQFRSHRHKDHFDWDVAQKFVTKMNPEFVMAHLQRLAEGTKIVCLNRWSVAASTDALDDLRKYWIQKKLPVQIVCKIGACSIAVRISPAPHITLPSSVDYRIRKCYHEMTSHTGKTLIVEAAEVRVFEINQGLKAVSQKQERETARFEKTGANLRRRLRLAEEAHRVVVEELQGLAQGLEAELASLQPNTWASRQIKYEATKEVINQEQELLEVFDKHNFTELDRSLAVRKNYTWAESVLEEESISFEEYSDRQYRFQQIKALIGEHYTQPKKHVHVSQN